MFSWLRIFDIFNVPEPDIQRRSGVSRRDFLKVLGVTSVAASVPISLSKLVVPEQKLIVAGVKTTVDCQSGMTMDEIKLLNATLFDKLASGDPKLSMQAVDAVSDFTRMKMREDGFFRRIMPPIQVSNAELDRSIMTDLPVKLVDQQDAAAISIPFACLPMNLYIRGPRYRVMFDRIVTPRFTRDVDELRTWNMDPERTLQGPEITAVTVDETLQAEALVAAKQQTKLASNDDERRVAWSFWDWFRRKPREAAA